MKRETKYATGEGFNARLVRTPKGKDFAWCGHSTGVRDAKRIAAAMNRDAAQKRTIRELMAALTLSREQHEVCGHDDKCDYCREAREVADAALKPRAKR